MADTSAQDKSLPVSERKLAKARSEGQVARSRDLGHLTAFAGGGALIVALAPSASSHLQTMVAGDKQRQGDLLARIKGVRRKFAQDVGFLPPPVHIRDNLEHVARLAPKLMEDVIPKMVGIAILQKVLQLLLEVVVIAAQGAPIGGRIVRRLATCAEGFVGAASRCQAECDPASDPNTVAADDLRALVDAQLDTRRADRRAAAAVDSDAPERRHTGASRRDSAAPRDAIAAYGRFAS